MYYDIEIAGLKRQLPLCKVTANVMIGAFIMFGDTEITTTAATALLKRAPEFDVILTAESKGIPLAYEMARQSGNAKYIVARKEPKLYNTEVISTEVDSITTSHMQTLYLGKTERELMEGKKVLIVDDVISTGGSLLSLEKLVNIIGAEIAGRMTVLAEGDAVNRDDIVFLQKLPLFNEDGSIK